MEHRCFERIPVEWPVTIQRLSEVVGEACIREISPDGLTLRFDDPLAIAGREILGLRVHGHGGRDVEFRGLVIHRNGTGAGIMLLEGSQGLDRLMTGATGRHVA